MLWQPGDAPGQIWHPCQRLTGKRFKTSKLLGFNGNSSRGVGETVSAWREGDRGTTPGLEEGALTPATVQLQAVLPPGQPEEPALSY